MTFNIEKSMRSLVSVLGIFLALFIVSCEDDDHAHEEEHIDAEGFILESDGTEIYREFKGTKTGSVTLAVGDTLELSVHFLGDDGKELEHDDHEGEEEEEEEAELRVSGFNSSIATVEFEEEHDDHGDDHEEEMALEIIGLSAGSTSFKLELMHDEHADYTSTNNVPITVK
ncbi:MAG: hypothetical protein ACKVKJ_06775 [Fidelibacterota bacterium]|jgi:hypothetical protein|tara:strand:+ start:510 stop:1022 length:513 start_codon:yes stop_codon:yes gene_type:complete